MIAHGAWADATSWREVIALLQARGLRVVAVQNPLSALAEADPEAGMREAVDTGSGRTIYLDQDVVLTNEDIAETRVVTLSSGFGVEVDFTEAGASKMRSATTENIGRLLAIVVDGDVLAAPTVRSPIDRIGVISGDFTREEAERLAEGIRRP